MNNRTNIRRPNFMHRNHLLVAYNQMIIDMESILSQTQHGYLSLQQALETATEKALQSGAINRDEAAEIARYIKNDVNDVADAMMESGAECYDWLLLDIEMIEHKVLDRYLLAASLTRGIMAQLRHG